MAEKSETLVTKDERINEAKELFGRGSRNYCMKQFAEAADDLSACCAIYSELNGPNAEECGLPYLLYAKSLIALGKDENNLLVPGDDEEEIDDDEEGEEGEDAGAEGEDGEEEAPRGEEDEEDGTGGDEKEKEDKEDDAKEDDDEKMDTDEASAEASQKEEDKSVSVGKENEEAEKAEKKAKEKEKTAEGSSSATYAQDDPQPGPSSSNGNSSVQEGAESTPGNLQVAWEVLELAVKIFEGQGDKAYENLSECYCELAGISFENSHFHEAINDYTKAMEISAKTNNSDLRMLAEMHYKVGLCHLMTNDYDASVTSLHGAIAEMDKVIVELKAKEQTDDTKNSIAELEETKEDILEKIADVEDAKKTSIEEVKRHLSKVIDSGRGESSNGVNNGAGGLSSLSSSANGASNGSASTATAASPAAAATTKPANDISHLIKRKKPDSDSAVMEGSPAKKTASDTDKDATHNTSA